MPRYARLKAPGALVHVIIRFVDHEYRIDTDGVRQRFLDQLATCLDRVVRARLTTSV